MQVSLLLILLLDLLTICLERNVARVWIILTTCFLLSQAFRWRVTFLKFWSKNWRVCCLGSIAGLISFGQILLFLLLFSLFHLLFYALQVIWSEVNIFGHLWLDLKILSHRAQTIEFNFTLAFKWSFVHCPSHRLIVNRGCLWQVWIVDAGYVFLVNSESVVHAGVDAFIVHLLFVVVIELCEMRLLVDYTAWATKILLQAAQDDTHGHQDLCCKICKGNKLIMILFEVVIVELHVING